ncbi:MAG: orotate phosphoribosyltransferase [Acidimicrobiia bacterium]|nr:orotate phosphoribosyltransferase [Acidimicrobiia bacterium]
MSSEHAELVEHLRINALKTEGPYTLRSGAISAWYLDARPITFSGRGARIIGPALLVHVHETVEAVGGMTMGADPVAMAVALAATLQGRDLNAFSIRKAAKDHGLGGRLVGPVGPGSRVAILEDTTTTGGAFFEAVDVAVSEGLEVVQAISLIDRSGGMVTQAMMQREIPYTAVVVPADLGVES